MRNIINIRDTSFESLQHFLFWKTMRLPANFLFHAGFRQEKLLDWVSGDDTGPSTSLLNLSEFLTSHCAQREGASVEATSLWS